MTLLLLWDVDHTLIDNSGVSKLIYASAFQTLAGRPPVTAAVTEGRTDRAIMRGYFEAEDLAPPPWNQTEAALAAAGEEHRGALMRLGRVLPGVEDVLAKLYATVDVEQSVLTGNIRANAEVKVGAFDLDRFFDLEVGAYGADAEDRPDLVAVAVNRYVTSHGQVPSSVTLIGDTPRDVQAAREAEVSVLAVATGIHTTDQLRDAGARVVLENLSDTDAVLSVLAALARDV